MLDAKVAASEYMRKDIVIPSEIADALPKEHGRIYDLYMAGVPLWKISRMTGGWGEKTLRMVIRIYTNRDKNVYKIWQ